MIQFFFLAGLFFSPITVLGNMFNEALTAMAGAERVFSILDTEPEWTDPPDALSPEQLHGQVELRDVGFSYQPGRPILHTVSFTAEAGQCVAIVGATGAVGVELIRCLEDRNFPLSDLHLFASARSAGKTVRFRDREIAIEALTGDSFAGVDIAFFSAGLMRPM